MKPIDQPTLRQINAAHIRKFMKTYPGFKIAPPLGGLMGTMLFTDLIPVIKRRLVRKPKVKKQTIQERMTNNLRLNEVKIKEFMAAHPGKRLAYFNEAHLATNSWTYLKPILEASLVDA